MVNNPSNLETIIDWRADWNKFARDVLNVRLDRAQRRILSAVQESRKTSVRSGHARGKDYVAAVAALCFLYLYYKCKVICTAPTDRQVVSVNMSEISTIHSKARIRLGGDVLSHRITFPGTENKDWYLEAFKAGDQAPESWGGRHSPNIMVIVTEATGIEDVTFDAIEGLLTGYSKLLILFNPIRIIGAAYESTRSKHFSKFKLNCLNAPNVRAKKILIPGQVDYEWVVEHVDSWCEPIDEINVSQEMYDFKFDGNWYRPSDLFLMRVMGEFPRESEDVLIPRKWVEMANDRWIQLKATDGYVNEPLVLGADIAGMGRDNTVLTFRRGDMVEYFKSYLQQDHMKTAGIIKNELRTNKDCSYIDTIGEGAGVYSRLKEQKVRAISVKFSEAAKYNDRELTDLTGERKFLNMKSYLYWALRDALDPKFDCKLALPPDDELLEELTSLKWELKSNGKIKIEEKEKLKQRLGRSPDKADSLVNTFYRFGAIGGKVYRTKKERAGVY